MRKLAKSGLKAVPSGLLLLALAACGGGSGSPDATASASTDDAVAANGDANSEALSPEQEAEVDKALFGDDADSEGSGQANVLAAAQDRAAPAISVTGGTWVKANVKRTITGTASDNVGVTQVNWYNWNGGAKGNARRSANGKSVTWTIDGLTLAPGRNVIYVAARDAAGNKTRTKLSLVRPLDGGTAAPAPAPAPSPAPAPAPKPSPAPAPAPTPVTGGSGAALSPACAKFYANSFSLTSLLSLDSLVSLGKPTKGVAVAEPTYRTCLVRSTDHTADGVTGFARNDYSRRQAFNANSSKQLVSASDGYWHLYDANTRAHLKVLNGPAADAEPQWHPSNPDLLYYIPPFGLGMKLHELNVTTGATRVVGDFAARLKAKWPGAAAAWTRSEGSPSADGRYWCFMVDNASWGSVGVFTWDRDTNTILGMYNTNGERPDHVSMTPSGNYCVVSSDGALGTTAFSRDFSTKKQLLSKSEHSDIALTAEGDDAYVAVDYNSQNGDVFMVNIRTGARTPLFSTYVNGTATALHISGKAFNKKGWVVVSTYAESGALKWLHRKIMAVQLTANPKIYTLAHHRSGANGYWTTPVASVNRDFTRVAFNSNWGNGSEMDVDDYVVEIPATALK